MVINRITNDSGSGAMSVSADHPKTWKLAEVRVTLDAVSADLADLSITIDSILGAGYDHEIGAPDPDEDLTTVKSFRYADQVPAIIFPGEQVLITWPNTGSIDWAVEVIGYVEG